MPLSQFLCIPSHSSAHQVLLIFIICCSLIQFGSSLGPLSYLMSLKCHALLLALNIINNRVGCVNLAASSICSESCLLWWWWWWLLFWSIQNISFLHLLTVEVNEYKSLSLCLMLKQTCSFQPLLAASLCQSNQINFCRFPCSQSTGPILLDYFSQFL